MTVDFKERNSLLYNMLGPDRSYIWSNHNISWTLKRWIYMRLQFLSFLKILSTLMMYSDLYLFDLYFNRYLISDHPSQWRRQDLGRGEALSNNCWLICSYQNWNHFRVHFVRYKKRGIMNNSILNMKNVNWSVFHWIKLEKITQKTLDEARALVPQ